MDIKQTSVNETFTLHLRDAAGELLYDGEQPVTITIYGPGSRIYARAQSAQNRRILEKARQRAKAIDATADRAEFLADITVGSACIEYTDAAGQPITGRAMYEAIYLDPNLGFIANQVMAEAQDWANFTKRSPTN